MTTLTTLPVSELLDNLFANAATADANLVNWNQRFSDEELSALKTTTTGYRALYSRIKDLYLGVSRETGKLLYLLARATGAKSIIEYGTSFGLSTIHLAAALRDNGGGRLIGSEFEPSKIAGAREKLRRGRSF